MAMDVPGRRQPDDEDPSETTGPPAQNDAPGQPGPAPHDPLEEEAPGQAASGRHMDEAGSATDPEADGGAPEPENGGPESTVGTRKRPQAATIVVVLLLLGLAVFVVADQITANPPSMEEIETRILEGDPGGNNEVHRFVVEIGGPFVMEFTGLSDPATQEHYYSWGDTTAHIRGDLMIVTRDGQAQMSRSYLEEDELFDDWLSVFGTDEPVVKITGQDGLEYRGWTIDEEVRIRVVLDDKHRIETVEYIVEGTPVSTMVFSYDNIRLPPFDENTPRAPAEIAVIPVEDQSPESFYGIHLDEMTDSVKPEELELRFFDFQGEIVETIRFDEQVQNTPGGFMFSWSDSNENGLVDREDGYSVKFPEGVAYYRVWDRWAEAYVDDVERIDIPAPPALALVVVLAALIGMHRHKRRRDRAEGGGKRPIDETAEPPHTWSPGTGSRRTCGEWRSK